MTEIYLIRHTQAEGNRLRILQGQWDGGVTALGLRQLDALAERFRDVKLDALYSSDLYRARLTALAVGRYHQLPLHTEPQLREIHVGRWETLFFGNVAHEEPELARSFQVEAERWAIEGGETYAQVRERGYAALRRIAEAHPDQVVAVASHGGAIRCILSVILGMPLEQLHTLPVFGNTSVTHLFWDGSRFTVDYMNDTSHLSAMDNPSWGKVGTLRDEPLDPAADRDFYTACYADAWQTVHGSLEDFSPQLYFDSALRHLEQDPRAVLRLYHEDNPAGLVDLDPARGAHAGYGWVSFLYLCPEYRGKGYGIQALARAISLYRVLGRRTLRLHVADTNARALAFYEREGFRALSEERGSRGTLLLMERPLEEPRDV